MEKKSVSVKGNIVGFLKTTWNKYMPYEQKTLKRMVVITTVIYAWCLVWALWLKFNDNRSITLNYSWLSEMSMWDRFMYDIVPFDIRFDHFRQTMQLFYNAIAFAPFGVLLNFLFKKENVWRDVAICFGVSLFIELLQLFTIIGNFATHDLIMNSLGYFLGFIVFKLFFNKMSVKFNVIFFFIVNILGLGITVFSVVRTIQNIEPIILILTKQY